MLHFNEPAAVGAPLVGALYDDNDVNVSNDDINRICEHIMNNSASVGRENYFYFLNLKFFIVRAANWKTAVRAGCGAVAKRKLTS